MIELKKYRDKWIAEGVNDYIGFFTREFTPLDNFSCYGFDYKGRRYITVEHAYQSYKFISTAPEIAEKIRLSSSPYDAKMIAVANQELVDPKWKEKKVSLMEEFLLAKLEQNPHVKKKLLETEDYLICEDSPEDTFWGIGINRDGENQMGKLWMKIRDRIRKENA